MRLRESCSTPHHPMRASLPTVFCTTTGISKNTFQKSLPKTPFITPSPPQNKTARKLSQRKQDSATRNKYYNICSADKNVYFHTRFNAVAIEKSSDQPRQYQYGTSFTAGPELCLSARMEMYGVTIFRNAP